MNKLITTADGGMPIVLNDIRFVDEAIREAFYGLISAFGITAADSFILSGCALTIGLSGSDAIYDNTAGFICLAGEIYAVDAHTGLVVGAGTTARWDVVTSNHADGAKVFADGNTQQTYQVRKAQLIASADTSKMPAAAPTLVQKIRTLSSLATAWTTPILGAAFTSVAGQEVSYRLNAMGNLEIRGNFTATSADGTLFTLPSGKRPSVLSHVVFIYDPTTASDYGYITVETDGDVVVSDAGTSGKVNSLQHTIFM